MKKMILFVSLLLIINPCFAIPIIVHFEGVVTDVGAPLAAQFQVNQKYQGSFSFDSDAVITENLSGFNFYGNSVTDLHFSIGDYAATAGPSFNTSGSFGSEVNASIISESFIGAGADNIIASPVDGLYGDIWLTDYLQAFSYKNTMDISELSDITLGEVTESDLGTWYLDLWNGGSETGVRGDITSIIYSVSEPETISILAFYLLATYLMHRIIRLNRAADET